MSLNVKSTIKLEFKVVIVEKYNPREWMEVNTAIKIRNENNEIESHPLRSGIMDYSSIGDSIIKIPNENIVVVKKKEWNATIFLV